MSAKSDKFEKDVASQVDSIPGVKASRPSVSTEYSDVLIEAVVDKRPVKTWLEVKMSHTDNLSNPRVYYENGLWKTTYKTPAAKAAVDILNRSPQSKKFLKFIKIGTIENQKHNFSVHNTDTIVELSKRLNTKCIIWGSQTLKERSKSINDFCSDKSRIIICNINLCDGV